MKKTLSLLMLVAALSGCEEANKAIDKAQDAANSAVDTMQEKMESVDLGELNLEKLGDASKSAEALILAVDEALNADFSDPEVLINTQEHIANAYKCLVDMSSESTAEKMMAKVMETIGNPETKTLIEQGVEKAQAAKECVM
ncbi:hypothetical protein ACFFLZ_07290 [Photobacterium aphoticum]|uniref:Lipoprotein n=1 Tax=Photobacterium aphoticum TaxID=754436 RepID=A0A0J1GNF6_9GAMM|nr:hypothetical protein [Photobacterium aphoticum]KLV01278.1 lipoprotein [Photobacterium aphoticum]PSU56134.1 hypothetical protein C9I90_13890 [Photobacterium aphoticum]